MMTIRAWKSAHIRKPRLIGLLDDDLYRFCFLLSFFGVIVGWRLVDYVEPIVDKNQLNSRCKGECRYIKLLSKLVNLFR